MVLRFRGGAEQVQRCRCREVVQRGCKGAEVQIFRCKDGCAEEVQILRCSEF
jgi:hypothetical protein